jgi:hypothetical protein
MHADATHKLALGSMLSVLGAAIIVLSPLVGWTELARPWSFILGFAGGVTAGSGVPLALCGLAGVRGRRQA